MKKVVVLLIAGLTLNSCGNKPSDPGSSNEKPVSESIQTKPELMKYTKSPQFSISELIEMLKLTSKEYENHVLCKGYKSHTSKKRISGHGYIYHYVYPNAEIRESSSSCYTYMGDKMEIIEEVEWSTQNANDFLKLFNEIHKLGFNSLGDNNSGREKETFCLSYVNDSLSIKLIKTKTPHQYAKGFSGSGPKYETVYLSNYSIEVQRLLDVSFMESEGLDN